MAKERKLLIVDDEELICKYLQAITEARDWKVFYALTGEEALELFKKNKPAACLIDIMLSDTGGMNGDDVVREIRKLDKNVRCIMITREDSIESKIKLKKLGANEYYVKPLDSKEMIEILDKLNQTFTKK